MTYGCIGNPLGHSFSEIIHSKIGRYEYKLHPLLPEELDSFMTARDFLGINVTIPYKRDVIPYLDEIDGMAKDIGAVNTIVNKSGKLYGYNTDFSGMRAAIVRAGIDAKDKKALVLGTGGTSRTAVAVLNSLGAREIYRVSRSGREGAITYDEAYKTHADAEIIVNTSPVGMYPNNSDTPVDIEKFPKLSGVFDAVFNPLSTNLVLDARTKGIKAAAGLYMLVYQGVCASEHFLGEKLPAELADRIFDDIFSERENIVLIGMASSGKSTVGKMLAERLGRKFFDTDALIVERSGMEIAEIFDKHGEDEFRHIEREVVSDVAKENGAVIATGGGTSLYPVNMKKLRQNGRVYLLDRSPDLLTPTFDRPLARDIETMKRRYYERHDIYRSATDEIIINNGTPDAAADEIERIHTGK
ncbi:MAG: shikimate dehydrogenase [Clostridia bacterium]|nr:shikimate dehydrogenase [Clostridia bacterium]